MRGNRLGPYEILEQLGAGGMGEVWLAEDTRLGREVAVKVLPEEFAGDPERLARFEQEARAAASLNHPHIAAVFDVGESGGTHYMVQELLEGESLRDALHAGPLPRARALGLAAEIAEGLAAAHEAGIVHRDLKPDNVFVSPSGHAKILDFGLAKLTEPMGGGGSAAGSETRSPTMLGTMAGTVMGSAGYMAPEQVAGDTVDRRADVFALGCLLYEMLTGERAFEGETLIDTLHAITRSEPQQMRELDSELAADLRWPLEKCLAKSPGERYQHADDLAIDLRRLASRPGPIATAGSSEPAPPTGQSIARAIPWRTLVLAAVIAVIAYSQMPSSVPEPELVSLALPAHLPPNRGARYFAISPDGHTVAYMRNRAGVSSLVLRDLDSFEERPVVGSEGALGPFFSPDGRRLAFFARGQLWSVDIAGGNPRPIADVAQSNSTAVWAEDDTIWLVAWATGEGLQRADAAGGGGTEEVVPEVPGDYYYLRPRLLPDGSGVAVESGLSTDRFTRIFFFDGSPPIRVPAPQLTYLPDGTALFVDAGQLFRADYDAGSWEVVGQPTALVDDVVDYFVADSGTLVYRKGLAAVEDRPVRRRRDGSAEILAEQSGARPQISSDGTRIAAASSLEGDLIEVWDVRSGNRRVLDVSGLYPQWDPDGRSLYYRRQEGNQSHIARISLDDTDGPEEILTSELSLWPTDVSPDGRLLALYQIHPDTERDIWILPLDGSGDPNPWLVTPASERSAVFSPDGRWIAYMSDSGGSQQVYVQPAPGNETPQAVVTVAAGREPRWAPDGSEIYFRRDDGLWAVPVSSDGAFSVGDPDLLFRGRFAREEGGENQQYDVFPNGDFLMLELPDELPELRVVTNWLSTLAR